MKAHLLIVLGLLAAISPATAQPEEDGARVRYRGDGERYRPSRSERDWSRIVSPTPTRFGTEYIIVGKDAGVFRTLRIDAVSGRVQLRRVSVLSEAGTWKTFYVNRRLDRKRPHFYVDLGASTQIAQLVITTDRRVAGTYVIYGRSGRIGPVLVASR